MYPIAQAHRPDVLMARPERFERPTPWFVGLKFDIHIYINQSLTSVRHTQKQYKPATESLNKCLSGTDYSSDCSLLTFERLLCAKIGRSLVALARLWVLPS